jgi:carbon storage regulator
LEPVVNGNSVVHRSRRKSMLVLTRKQGEKVVIGDDVRVGVVQVTGNKVVLSFEAPGEVRILRAELGEWQDRSTARHLDASDPDLKEKPTEWEELSFSSAPARRARKTVKRSRTVQT